MEIELPNGRIHADVRGSGTPVLIMHGGGLDHRHMLDTLEPVFERTTGWRRVYIDLPGHGKSTVSDSVSSQDDVLGMISSFVDVAFDGEKSALIGESRGGYHAMGLAHIRPNDFLGMMLIVAGGMTSESVERLPQHQNLVKAPEPTIRNASPDARSRFERLVIQTPEILEKIELTKVPAAELADQELAERITGKFTFSFDLSKPARKFERPCLFINGRQDALAGYRDMIDSLELYPHATLAILDHAGHSVSWERPVLFEALTFDWLHRLNGQAEL